MYKLIIVEDEEKILSGIGMLFPWDSIGFKIEGQFTNAAAALSFIENNEINVVMSDIKMPGMSGIELCEKLAPRNEIKTVLFSSYSDYEFMRSAIHCNATDYLLKPINYAKLYDCFSRVKAILDEERSIVPEIPQTYYEKIVHEIDQYLREHFQDATLEKAAIHVKLSPTYLSKIYKEKSKISFSDTLTQIRMEKACEMLGDIQYKTYEIAYYIGYDNPKNFSRAFKAYYKKTPSEYRREKLEDKC